MKTTRNVLYSRSVLVGANMRFCCFIICFASLFWSSWFMIRIDFKYFVVRKSVACFPLRVDNEMKILLVPLCSYQDRLQFKTI